MNSLYLHFPCKVTADDAPNLPGFACPYAVVANDGTLVREGLSPLAELSVTVAKLQRVIVILSASDVTLLQVSIPPLSAAKLKAALPNLVEDKLLGNSADCIVVAGDVSNGLRTVAVVQRTWLENISKTLIAFGARHISILPAPLCLPHQAGQVVAAISQHDNDTDLTLRLSEQTGMGLALSAHQPEEVIRSLCTIVPNMPIALHVPQTNIAAYQAALNTTGLTEHISIAADNWPMWIAGARNAALNLMTGLNAESSVKVDWRPWRWSLILAAAILVVNIIALNFDWWQMTREARNLRSTLTQIYHARYPNESVIIDPIAQMRQKISFAKRDSGLSASDDFTALASSFGEAWNGMTAPDKPAIAKLEYREHMLLVSFKPGSNNPEENLMQQMKAALASHNLSLTVALAQTDAVIWQIRSAP